ncbi:MAG: hypothetical protein ACRDNZ_21330 [Streptosporangiaceae bacterium]
MTGYGPPGPLTSEHDTSGFDCRSREQADWLRRHARQAGASGTTRVSVVTGQDGRTVVAYYAWCMAQVAVSDAPARMSKGAGRYPRPVALLARLGVDHRHEGRGLGAGLLQDVFTRLVCLPAGIGCRGLLIHAESAEARKFCLHLVPEFDPSPTDDMHLVLLMKDIRRTLHAGEVSSLWEPRALRRLLQAGRAGPAIAAKRAGTGDATGVGQIHGYDIARSAFGLHPAAARPAGSEGGRRGPVTPGSSLPDLGRASASVNARPGLPGPPAST